MKGWSFDVEISSFSRWRSFFLVFVTRRWTFIDADGVLICTGGVGVDRGGRVRFFLGVFFCRDVSKV